MGEAGDGKTALLVMRCSRGRIGLPLIHVVETMRPLACSAFSGPAGYVRGVAIIRGRPVPVVSINGLLDTADEGEEEAGRFVLTKFAERQVALKVTEVEGVARLDDATLKQCPPLLAGGDARSSLITSLAVLDGQFFALLNAALLVPDEEWAALREQGLLS